VPEKRVRDRDWTIRPTAQTAIPKHKVGTSQGVWPDDSRSGSMIIRLILQTKIEIAKISGRSRNRYTTAKLSNAATDK
jgi:hypothetical protein